jgi:hypothetical protein
MIGIQFGVYELMKRALSPKESLLKSKVNTNKKVKSK